MKLTKGKIAKLYNKKRQSLKRAKKGKPTSYKRKTFRNKKGFDLSRKTLKRHRYQRRRGGAIEENEPKVVSEENTPREDIENVKPITEPEKSSEPITSDSVSEQPVLDSENPEESAAIKEPIQETGIPGATEEGMISADEMKNMSVEPTPTTVEQEQPSTTLEEQ